MLSPMIAAHAAMTITVAMSKRPRAARIDAVISAVSPGSGMPIDSPAISSARTGSPTWATSMMAADTRLPSQTMSERFEIQARDEHSRARAGVLRTAHGDVRTPAFVPLATKATVKGLEPHEVAALGYDMVLA